MVLVLYITYGVLQNDGQQTCGLDVFLIHEDNQE